MKKLENIRIGQKASFKIDGYADIFNGKIVRIGRSKKGKWIIVEYKYNYIESDCRSPSWIEEGTKQTTLYVEKMLKSRSLIIL